jgi:serine/threonine-protein kinase RsbW
LEGEVQQRQIALAAQGTSLSDARGFADTEAAAAGFGPEERYRLVMAVNEAVSNAIEHGRPCHDGITLSASTEDLELVFYVRDCGHFSLEPKLVPDPVSDRGRGYAVMSLLVDDVRLDAGAGPTVVRLATGLPAADRVGEQTEAPECADTCDASAATGPASTRASRSRP